MCFFANIFITKMSNLFSNFKIQYHVYNSILNKTNVKCQLYGQCHLYEMLTQTTIFWYSDWHHSYQNQIELMQNFVS